MEDQKHPGGKYAIYELCCPESGDVRYIGQTTSPTKRLATHCCPSYRDDTRKAGWVRSLLAAGRRPVMNVVEWCDDWDEAERRWVAKHRAAGIELLNGNDGGRTTGHLRLKKTRPPSAVTYLLRRLRNFAKDLSKKDPAKAETFRDIAEGIVRRRREARRHGVLEQYDNFIASILGDRWAAGRP